jgi:hypothetical protein
VRVDGLPYALSDPLHRCRIRLVSSDILKDLPSPTSTNFAPKRRMRVAIPPSRNHETSSGAVLHGDLPELAIFNDVEGRQVARICLHQTFVIFDETRDDELKNGKTERMILKIELLRITLG